MTLADLPVARRLSEAAVAADPAPGTALDGLPDGPVAGVLYFAGDLAGSVRLLAEALERPEWDGDPWVGAMFGASLVMSAAAGGLLAEGRKWVGPTVEFAMRSGNPSVTAYALAGEAYLRTLEGGDPAGIAALLERSRALASEVGNHWVLGIVGFALGNARASSGDPAGALTAFLDTADDLHRSGWSTHSWQSMWLATGLLHRLERLEEGALFLGACQASGIQKLAPETVAAEFEVLTADDGDPHLAALRAVGSRLELPELVRIATGQRPVPIAGERHGRPDPIGLGRER
jgi:hypothetical protein